jgi:imidazolonepropionase-like amidohydrolase
MYRAASVRATPYQSSLHPVVKGTLLTCGSGTPCFLRLPSSFRKVTEMTLIAVLLKKRAPLFGALFLFLAALPASAQMRGNPGKDMVLIKGARVVTMAGPDLCPGDVLVRKGKIRAVGPSLRVPRGVRVIDAAGKVVIPGLIDANSVLLVTPGRAAGGNAASSVLDAVDIFRTRDVEGALSQGVTTVALFPPPKSGFAGKGAVIRLKPGVPLEEMILSEAVALKACIGLGSYGRPVARLGEIKKFRSSLKAAADYREAWEEYEEELEEYVKKLEERAEEEGDKKEGDEKKGKNDKGEGASGKKSGKASGKSSKKEEDKKKDDLEKPKKPRFSAASEELLRALKGEIPLFVEVHRAADIVNVLGEIRDSPVKLVLVGCSEGYLVADKIAESGATALMGPLVREAVVDNSEFKNHCPWCAAVLKRAGVPVVLAGSGRGAGETRHLALHAAMAAAYGFEKAEALSAVTLDAARLLGLDDRIGSIEKGKDADLVILSGDPLSSSAAVETVFIKGEEVYSRGE